MASCCPLVTIITPTYNRASYLAETIDSVLAQDYRPIEYIVLDDGSTDNTEEILGGYGDRIRWVKHPNMGEVATVNRGFSLANGEIVAVVNSDDPLLPHAISRAVEVLERNPDILVAYPDWVSIDARSIAQRCIRVPDYDYMHMVRRFQCIVGPGAFIRREAIEKTGGRDESYRFVSDLEFWLRLGLIGPFMRIPEPLATFRVHSESTSVCLQGQRLVDEHIRLARDFYSRPEVPRQVRAVRGEAMSWAYYYAGLAAGPDHKLAWKCFRKAVSGHLPSCAAKWRLLVLLVVPRKFHRRIRGIWWRFRAVAR